MINIDAEIYREFKCKADKCKHSCCKGWEIDIDEDTLDYYKGLETDIGAEIMQSIEEGEDTFFKLCKQLLEQNPQAIIVYPGGVLDE